MADRLDLVLSILRFYEMHAPECALGKVLAAQRETTMYLVRPACDCWLSRPPGQEETAPARDLSSDLPSPEELNWAFAVLDRHVGLLASDPDVDDRDGIVKAYGFIRAELEDLQFRMDGLNK